MTKTIKKSCTVPQGRHPFHRQRPEPEPVATPEPEPVAISMPQSQRPTVLPPLSAPLPRETVVWFVHRWWEADRAQALGLGFFDDCVICRRSSEFQYYVHQPDVFKILVLGLENLLYGCPGTPEPSTDLTSQADLIVIFSSEPLLNLTFDQFLLVLQQRLHNSRLIFCCNGIHFEYANHNSSNSVYEKQLTWFSKVLGANDQRDITLIDEHPRPWKFDALLGQDKYHRRFLLYRVLEDNLQDQMLINILPTAENPAGTPPCDRIRWLDPEGHYLFKDVREYSSSQLLDLEYDSVREFKIKTQNLDANQRHSVNQVLRPGYKIFNSMISAAVIIPQQIYQNTWYSVVTESVGGGPQFFLTEKTAKCLLARRVFVMMNAFDSLELLRQLGFETFHGKYIDESYDREPDDRERFHMAWQQIKRLMNSDPREVYNYYRDRLEHNHQRIYELDRSILRDLRKFIGQYLPSGVPIEPDEISAIVVQKNLSPAIVSIKDMISVTTVNTERSESKLLDIKILLRENLPRMATSSITSGLIVPRQLSIKPDRAQDADLGHGHSGFAVPRLDQTWDYYDTNGNYVKSWCAEWGDYYLEDA